MNKDFEEPCDPFQNHRRRYKNELDRYLANGNLDFLPPMPKPKYPERDTQTNSNMSNKTKGSSESPNSINNQVMLTMTENTNHLINSNTNYSSNEYEKIVYDNQSYGNNIMTKSTEFEY